MQSRAHESLAAASPAAAATSADAQPGASRRRSRWVSALIALACLAALPGVATLVMGSAPTLQAASRTIAKASAFVHFGVLAWVVAALFGVVALAVALREVGGNGRLRAFAAGVVAMLALAGLVVQASWLAPYLVADGERPASEPFTVMTLNVEFGVKSDADAERIAGLAQAADLVTLQEVTAESLDRLRDARFDEHFPYRVGDGAPGATGTIVAARFPVELIEWIPTGMQSLIVRAVAPGGSFVLAAVHPVNPFASGDGWARDGDLLREGIRPYLGEPLVVAGDFNAIDRHLVMQHLADDGLRNAADVAGAGLQTTWPDNRRFPALLAIDHVLVGTSMTALDVWTVEAPNTDHRAVFAVVAHRAPDPPA